MITKLKAALFAFFALGSVAHAQTAPDWSQGYVPTPAEWNAVFANKQDYLGAAPLLVTGGAMSGELATVASTASFAGFNMAPGVAPSSPLNGDMWTTATGVFVQINGATINLTGSTSASFGNTSPIALSFPAGVVTYACPTCGVTGNPLSQFAATTSAQLAGVISDETGTGLLVFNNAPALTSPVITGPLALPSGTTATNMSLTTPSLGIATATSVNGITITTGTGVLTLNTFTASLGGNLASTAAVSFTGAFSTAAAVTHAGAFATTITTTAITNSTLPAGTHTLAGLDVAQTWAALQSHADNDFALNGATSGNLTLRAAAVSGTSVIRFPAGSIDFSATGGTGQYIKQASAGGALTVSVIAAADLPLATNAAIGGMRGDGTTITCTAGVCQSLGGAASSVSVGTTSVLSGTSGDVLTNNAGVLGNATIASLLVGQVTSVLMGGSGNNNLSNTTTNYSWNSSVCTSATSCQQPITIPGTISQLSVWLTSSPGSGKSYTFVLMKNGVATSVTCAVANAAQTCNDATDSVTVAANDLLQMESLTPAGTPTAVGLAFSLQFVH